MSSTDLISPNSGPLPSPALPPTPDLPVTGRAGRRLDLLMAGAELVFVAAIAIVGLVLKHRGVPIHAGAAPLAARWDPHVGIGTPFSVGIAVLVIRYGFSRPVAAWSWRRLLWTAYAASLGWIVSLALIDGWHHGIASRLAGPDSYLVDAAAVDKATYGPLHHVLATFTAHILAVEPGSGPGYRAWPTDIAGHPPGALLVFVGLHRIGLGSGGAAGAVCIVVAALAPVCVAITLRSLSSAAGSELTARAALPFLVLFPGAIWAGTSADGLFMGVAAAGVALMSTRGWWRSAAGGVLIGYTLYLSYGLVLFGLIALAVLWLKPAQRVPGLVAAGAGFGLVVGAFTISGFWWVTGYHLVVRRYYQGWGAQRPYAYWVWADLACLVACAGPVLWPALRRVFVLVPFTVRGLLRRPGWSAPGDRDAVAPGRQQQDLRPLVVRQMVVRPLVVLPLLALVGILAADLSGLSKAEVERIWLPFAIWLIPAAVLMPGRRSWLIGQAIVALAINSLLLTAW